MSPDEAALMRAVLAAPDFVEPRLAYAARLADSSRAADRARAEFIRVQIELSELPYADPRSPALVARERELLDDYRTSWEKPLRDLFRPSLASPGRWLRSRLSGSGGLWGFRRGFVEHILAPAPSFLAEDAAILDHAPIRRVVLTHASDHVGRLQANPRLERLRSLHLIADMEMDEDLAGLAGCARKAGFTVLEFRLPRLWAELDPLADALRSDASVDLDSFAAWHLADDDGRERLRQIAASRRIVLFAREPADEGEYLARNEWVYLGREFSECGAWAVAKGHQDLEVDDGCCRRLVLVRSGRGEELRQSPFCIDEVR